MNRSSRSRWTEIRIRSTSRLGVGAGLAAALAVAEPHALRPGVSPELLLHFGRCCNALYWLASVRWDRYFGATDRNHWMANLGFVYWYPRPRTAPSSLPAVGEDHAADLSSQLAR